MRILIPSALAMTLAVAAAAAAMALHTPPSRPPQRLAVRDAAPPTDAVPGLVWRSGTATLRLMDGPCPSPEFAQTLETEGVTKARAYEVVQGSRRYTGCWTKDIGGDVLTLEPGRDIGSIPIDWFRRASGS